MGPTISIITVVYNRVSQIETCLRSVRKQSYPKTEHVIIDGGSTDGTVEVLQDHRNRIDFMISEPDRGPYDALNKGLALASGDFVGVLHSDDRFASHHTLAAVAEHLQTADTDSIYGDLIYLKDAQRGHRVVRRWVAGPYKRREFRKGWMPPHPTFFVRRSVVDELGGYRSEFGTAADYEFLLRYLYKHEVTTSYLPRTLVEMRVGGLSNGGLDARIRANSMDRRAWSENGLKPSWWFRLRKPARKLLQYDYSAIARRIP